MAHLDHDEIVALLLIVGTLLATARLLGELMARLHQPAIVGELLAGVLLGPTVLGRVAPSVFSYLFPASGPVSNAVSGLTNLALVLFLLVAGLEVDLSAAMRKGRAALSLGVAGIVIPFGVGFLVAYFAPIPFGKEPAAALLPFALFFATALSISALPVIAKTLMDLHLFRSELGVLIMAAAVFNDLIGWMIFAVILGMIGEDGGQQPAVTLALTFSYWVAMLAGGRWVFNRILSWLRASSVGVGNVLTIASAVALFGAAFTEWIGVHAIFGSFMVGVAFGDSPHLRKRVRHTLDDFVTHVLAPLFFASIGISVDFVRHLDLPLVSLVFVIATAGKTLGCILGGHIGGLSRRESWAAAAGMNARGAMEIILGLLALRFGLIGDRLFVALVIMALLTSMMSGPLMNRILRSKRKRRVTDFVTPQTFISNLPPDSAVGTVRTLCALAAPIAKLDSEVLFAAVNGHEGLNSAALGAGIAVPHARLSNLDDPVIAVGLSPGGIDFDPPDEQPVRQVVLLLTPEGDDLAQLELLADIARYATRGAPPALPAAVDMDFEDWRTQWSEGLRKERPG